jgi:hypothetical protein
MVPHFFSHPPLELEEATSLAIEGTAIPDERYTEGGSKGTTS